MQFGPHNPGCTLHVPTVICEQLRAPVSEEDLLVTLHIM